jgi:general secretion pathway protein G
VLTLVAFTGCQKSAQERLAEKILENIENHPGEMIDAAMTQISTLNTACKMYKLNVGKFPPNLEALVLAPDGMEQKQWRGPYLDPPFLPRDPWGSEFQYAPDDSTGFVGITSSGPDRQPGTADDFPDPSIEREENERLDREMFGEGPVSSQFRH